MNNKIATDETMSQMAEATRIRTRQLLRFSEGSLTILISVMLLSLGFDDYMKNICGGGQLLRKVCCTFVAMTLLIVACFIVVEIGMRKKKSLYADVYRRFIRQRVLFIMFTLLVLGVGLLEIWSPWLLSNRIFPGMIIFGILGLNDFRNFILARLPEDLASSFAFLGLSLTNIGWPLGNYIWLYEIFWGLIALLQGVILYIRWQRSVRQVSDESREKKEV